MSRSPPTQDAHGLDELLTGTCERVGDLGWRGVGDLTTDDAVRFELTKLRCQDFFADSRKKLAKLRVPFRTEAQMPDRQDLPFPADCIDDSLYRATVVIFQEPSILTKKCVLLNEYQMVIPFGQWRISAVRRNPRDSDVPI